MYFTSFDGSQNTFVNQVKINTLELKKSKCTDYVVTQKLNGVYNSKLYYLLPLFIAVLQSIKLSGYKMEIKIDKDHLAIETKQLLGQNFKCLHCL